MAPMEPDHLKSEELEEKAGAFRCHHCVREIGESETVYMRSDATFCSRSCRKRGRSWQYWEWKAPGESRSHYNHSPWSGNASSAMSALTESSSCSSSSAAGCQSIDELPTVHDGVINWIVRKAVGKIVSIMGGGKLMRTLTAAMEPTQSPLMLHPYDQPKGGDGTARGDLLPAQIQSEDFADRMDVAPH
mmetsp:Transcript_48080/g.88595  ORF Transcript_48080/g.88595 Transcript_48080/m.88595 type:complete len:189 (+) Transcript_48080:76-642(+)